MVRFDWSRLRNPGLFWRRIALGVALTIPGFVTGALMNVLASNLKFPLMAIFGAAGGFFVGYWMEGRN